LQARSGGNARIRAGLSSPLRSPSNPGPQARDWTGRQDPVGRSRSNREKQERGPRPGRKKKAQARVEAQTSEPSDEAIQAYMQTDPRLFSNVATQALDEPPQPLSPRIAAKLNAAVVALDVRASPVRPPPGLDGSMIASPLDQYASLYQGPPAHIASPCSPQAHHGVSPPAWAPNSPTRRAGSSPATFDAPAWAPTSPTLRTGSSPAIFSTVPVAPPLPPAPLPPLQPPTWPGSLAAQAPAWGVGLSLARLALSQLGASMPPPPPTWGPGLSTWAGVPSSPPPSWPAPRSLELFSPKEEGHEPNGRAAPAITCCAHLDLDLLILSSATEYGPVSFRKCSFRSKPY